MATTLTRRANAAKGNPPSGRPASTGRRSAPMALLGVAAVVVGALLFLGANRSIDDRQSVLALARPVASGQVIAAEDLTLARVSVSSDGAVVPASQRSAVVGKTATVGLVRGALLAPPQVGKASSLAAGEAIVGVALKAGQAPPGLRSGTRVQVVDTGGAGAAELVPPSLVAAEAIVADVLASASGSGVSVVSLRVPQGDAMAVAATNAQGRISLVVLPAS